MANTLSSLAPITTTATNLGNLVLVTPVSNIGYQPQNSFLSSTTATSAFSNPSLLFHYEGEQNVVIESDITDHYIEDNSALQDQISIKPETITTHGFIGELNDVVPYANQVLRQLQDKLSIISSYTPELTVTAMIAFNQAFQAYQIASNIATSAVATWSTINNTGENVIGNTGLLNQVTGISSFSVFALSQSRQQLAFQQFYAYWQKRTLFTVQTPWAVFQNMAILRLRAIQDSDTNTVSDFEITFKRIRTATSIFASSASANSVAGRLNQDIATTIPSGNTSISQSPQTAFSLGNFNLGQ